MDKIDRVCKFNGSTSTPLSFADGSDEPGEMTWQIRPHKHLTWTITCIFFFFFLFFGLVQMFELCRSRQSLPRPSTLSPSPKHFPSASCEGDDRADQ